MKSLRGMVLGLCVAFGASAFGEGEPPKMTAQQFVASLKFQQGEIKLPGGKAALQVPATFRYLGPEDAQRVLEQAWGNPEGGGTLGMLFPADVGPLDENSWGVVLTYNDDGHVSDEDADKIDYNELLKNMQQQTSEANDERARAGFERVELVGWAEPPQYDQATRKMVWAKNLRFGEGQNTLNYNVRVLGREGILVLNAVAGMDQLAQVKQQMRDVAAFANFNEGSRYSDFNADTDKLAGYGLAALVGGAVAAKAGLFAKIGALLLASKKIIGVGLLAVGAYFARRFKRKKDTAKNDVA